MDGRMDGGTDEFNADTEYSGSTEYILIFYDYMEDYN